MFNLILDIGVNGVKIWNPEPDLIQPAYLDEIEVRSPDWTNQNPSYSKIYLLGDSTKAVVE
jgi:hypothetical protein